MKYPITPDFLEAAPEYVVQLYRDLETFVLDDICRRFRESGEATATALEQIRLLQRRGLDLGAIEAYIKKTLSLSDQAFDEIFDRAVQRNRRYFDETLRRADIEADTVQRIALTNELDAIRRQTKERFYNITQSMGFALRAPDGRVRAHSIASAYQKILDDAELEVWSGGTSYREAVRNAVRRLSGSGLQWIDYESGHHNRVDVAARRAVMTGITQLSAQYSERTAEILQTPLREVTAHIGARDRGEGWQNHKRWQGRVYAVGQHERYPDIYAVCGLGYVDGLEGANCRHMHYAFVEGVSERAWTDEQLANIDPPPFTYQGKTYTAYDATQKQRQIETAMRAGKRDMVGCRAAGLEKEYQDSSIRLRRLNEEYRAFSKAANLPTQPERAHVEGFDRKDQSALRSVSGKFEQYARINGASLPNGTPAAITNHVIERAVGRGVPAPDALDALQNPLKQSTMKVDGAGRPSVRLIGARATVAVNPETGAVITVWKTHTKLAKKLEEGKHEV